MASSIIVVKSATSGGLVERDGVDPLPDVIAKVPFDGEGLKCADTPAIAGSSASLAAFGLPNKFARG